jgi:hypothetical protein
MTQKTASPRMIITTVPVTPPTKALDRLALELPLCVGLPPGVKLPLIVELTLGVELPLGVELLLCVELPFDVGLLLGVGHPDVQNHSWSKQKHIKTDLSFETEEAVLINKLGVALASGSTVSG